jgi:hypothetical protein
MEAQIPTWSFEAVGKTLMKQAIRETENTVEPVDWRNIMRQFIGVDLDVDMLINLFT